MRIYITNSSESKPDDPIPPNLLPYLRFSKPSVQGLVEQAVDEANVLGRLAIASSGPRNLINDVKSSVSTQLTCAFQDIFVHAEEFAY